MEKLLTEQYLLQQGFVWYVPGKIIHKQFVMPTKYGRRLTLYVCDTQFLYLNILVVKYESDLEKLYHVLQK